MISTISSQISMKWHSAWSASVAFFLFTASSLTYISNTTASSEILYLIVLALFHGIFSIWFWQGNNLPHFILSTICTRFFLAGLYLISAWQTYELENTLNIPASIVSGYIIYLVVQGTADFLSATFTAIFMLSNRESIRKTLSDPADNKLTLEIRNRFVFALYMFFLASWILSNSESFIDFFYLPSTQFSTLDTVLPAGPIHLIGSLILVLAVYNFVAIKYRFEKLISAGVRGGLFTCIFVLLLVVTGILHPITLLLPAVDLISVGIILLHSFRLNKESKK